MHPSIKGRVSDIAFGGSEFWTIKVLMDGKYPAQAFLVDFRAIMTINGVQADLTDIVSAVTETTVDVVLTPCEQRYGIIVKVEMTRSDKE